MENAPTEFDGPLGGERLVELRMSRLLDSPAEVDFDRLTRLAKNLTNAAVALVSLVDDGRQFFKSCLGLPEPWASDRETPLSHSFCQHVVVSSDPLCIRDAREHPLVMDNRAIADLGVVAYLGIPLTTSQGHTLGSLCVIDGEPRDWTTAEIELVQELAALVVERIELRTTSRQLLADFVRLQELEAYREEAVRMMVHDLRSPLTSFLGGIEMVRDSGDLNEDQADYLKIAYDGGEQVLSMVSGMLEASKDESAKLKLHVAPLVSSKILEEIHKQLAPLAQMAGVEMNFGELTARPFSADAAKLRRVLSNLISNAIQHTPSGGKVSLFSRDVDAAVQMTVADTGHGIAETEQERIFEKFESASTPRESGTSTGLGLAYCRDVVEAHGGRIWVESQPGKGSIFRFTVPTDG